MEAFLLALAIFCPAIAPRGAPASPRYRPNRVLLVIGDQWSDPENFLVREGNEYHEIASLLKNWGIPFDVVRLDEQRLDPNLFLDDDGRPLYGAILWDADPASLPGQNYTLLADAVEKRNIGLVALSNRIHQPVLESLLGVQYQGYYSWGAPIVPTVSGHFLLRGLPNPLDSNDDPRIGLTARGVAGVKEPWSFPPFKKRVLAETRGATVLAMQGQFPQMTLREVRPGTYAVWIGSDALNFLHYQALRTVLRRALTLAVGYQIYKDWTRDAILEMDDQGSAQNAWLEHWHYPTLTREQIEKNLIEPLEAHSAVLELNVCPGFVDRQARTIVPSFRQNFVDEFGTRQDYVSTKAGIEEGLRRGVFEVQSHGWTHMQPDLDSPPGPWWDAPIDGEKAEVGWYREFGDTRRGKEIPAAVQRLHLIKSQEWLHDEFGVTPLSFVAGGNGVSESPANNTTRLAAQAGFGWFGDYIGRDLALEALDGYSGMGGSEFGGTADAPLVVWIPPDGHDRGIAHHPEEFPKIFTQLEGWKSIRMNEYIAYVHAVVRSRGGDGLVFTIRYDDHYGRFLHEHASEWNLELPGADRSVRAIVDGNSQEVSMSHGVGAIHVPPGGEHQVEILP